MLVLLDLSAAFDTVDHGILITSLQSRFGVSGQVLEWFSGYLRNRSQRISVNGTLSDRFFLQYGVPQGSCLGPVLFIIYASKLFEIVKAHLLTFIAMRMTLSFIFHLNLIHKQVGMRQLWQCNTV